MQITEQLVRQTVYRSCSLALFSTNNLVPTKGAYVRTKQISVQVFILQQILAHRHASWIHHFCLP